MFIPVINVLGNEIFGHSSDPVDRGKGQEKDRSAIHAYPCQHSDNRVIIFSMIFIILLHCVNFLFLIPTESRMNRLNKF